MKGKKMGRQIRRVPLDWEHPKDEQGAYAPMFPQDMKEGEAYQLYEDMSEGTPISPVFEQPEDLVNHLITKGDDRGDIWSKESAEKIIKNGWAPTFVMFGGVMLRPHEQ